MNEKFYFNFSEFSTDGIASFIDPEIEAGESGRNNGGKDNGNASWSGTFEDLGIPADAVIVSIELDPLDYNLDEFFGNYAYFRVESSEGDLLDDYDYLGASPPSPNSISVDKLATESFSLDMVFGIRTANDKDAYVTLTINSLAINIEYIVPFDSPTISTEEATNIDATTATLNGELTSLGDATTVDVFFEWKELGAGSWNATTKNERTSTGAFNHGLTGLDSGTDCEFRAVVEYENNGTQRVEGSILTFTTKVQYILSISKEGNGSVELDSSIIALPYEEELYEGNYQLEAIAADDYNDFDKWVVNGSDVTENPTIITLDSNITVIAHFIKKNVIIIERGEGVAPSEWNIIDEVSLEESEYKDASGLIKRRKYSYRIKKLENGEFVVPPQLSAKLYLKDVPPTILLEWGED